MHLQQNKSFEASYGMGAIKLSTDALQCITLGLCDNRSTFFYSWGGQLQLLWFFRMPEVLCCREGETAKNLSPESNGTGVEQL